MLCCAVPVVSSRVICCIVLPCDCLVAALLLLQMNGCSMSAHFTRLFRLFRLFRYQSEIKIMYSYISGASYLSLRPADRLRSIGGASYRSLHPADRLRSIRGTSYRSLHPADRLQSIRGARASLKHPARRPQSKRRRSNLCRMYILTSTIECITLNDINPLYYPDI